MSNYLKCETVEHNPDNKKIDRSVIWMHGLGASGHDFVPVVPELGLSSDLAVRFVFPHAPQIPVTINGGMIMPAWYDILEVSLDRKVDVTQIQQSTKSINDLIEREVERGVKKENIVIAGFSQGGAIAYQVALTHPKKLGGLLALSTYLAIDDSAHFTDDNRNIAIKIDHGTQDPVVPVVLAQRAAESLKEKGYAVDFTMYPMAHQVCLPQIKAIGQWFNKVLA